MNTQAYENFVSIFKTKRRKKLLIAVAVVVLGFLLVATVIGAFAAIGAVIYLMMELVRGSVYSSHTKKSLKALHKDGQYEAAMNGLAQAKTCQLDELTYAWTEDFLYLPYGAIYPMKKVAWIYPYCHTQVHYLVIRIKTSACKLFLTDGSQSLLYYGKAKDEEAFKRLLVGLKEANPALLLGYTQENQQLYQQLKAGQQ